MAKTGDEVKFRIDLRRLDRDVRQLLRANAEMRKATVDLEIGTARVNAAASRSRSRRGRRR